jgi:hypothetical protein
VCCVYWHVIYVRPVKPFDLYHVTPASELKCHVVVRTQLHAVRLAICCTVVWHNKVYDIYRYNTTLHIYRYNTTLQMYGTTNCTIFTDTIQHYKFTVQQSVRYLQIQYNTTYLQIQYNTTYLQIQHYKFIRKNVIFWLKFFHKVFLSAMSPVRHFRRMFFEFRFRCYPISNR